MLSNLSHPSRCFLRSDQSKLNDTHMKYFLRKTYTWLFSLKHFWSTPIFSQCCQLNYSKVNYCFGGAFRQIFLLICNKVSTSILMSIFKIFIEKQHLQAEKFILLIEYMCLCTRKVRLSMQTRKNSMKTQFYKVLIAYDFCSFVNYCGKTQTTSQSLPGQT